MIKEAIERIQQMEQYFDMLQEAISIEPNAIQENSSLKEILQILIEYYEGGQWINDYTLDEKGFFPQDLKRGVLSQDGVFDLLSQINNIEE